MDTEKLVSEVSFDEEMLVADVPLDMPVEMIASESTAKTKLADLEALATANHPEILSAVARLDGLHGKWVQAGLPFNPVAQYNSDEVFNDDTSGLHRIAIGQTFVTAGKLSAAQAVTAEEIRAAQAAVETAKLRVQTRVRASFLAALVAQKRSRLVDQLRQIAEQSVTSVESMLQAEEVSRIALLQAQTEYQQAVLEYETATSNLAAARRILASSVGIEQLPNGELEGEMDPAMDSLSFEELRSRTIGSSPQMTRRIAIIEQARRSLHLACAQATPNITAQVGLGIDDATDDTFTSVQVSMPLPIRNRNQGNIRQARSTISQADQQLRETELLLAGKLATAYRNYQNAIILRDRLAGEIIPKAEEMLKLSVASFEAGESSYLQLLTVQRTLFQSRLRELEAISQVAQNANQIEGLLVGIE